MSQISTTGLCVPEAYHICDANNMELELKNIKTLVIAVIRGRLPPHFALLGSNYANVGTLLRVFLHIVPHTPHACLHSTLQPQKPVL